MKELFIWRLCFIVIATAGLIDIYIYILQFCFPRTLKYTVLI